VFDITDTIIDILGKYIPKLNKEMEISLIPKENEQQKDNSQEIRKNNYVILSELFVKMLQIVIRTLDEVLIPIIMVLKNNLIYLQFVSLNLNKETL
jgi:hypothetical protein